MGPSQCDEDKLSVMASDGDLLPSDARNSQGVPTSAGRDQEEADAERSAMLARASTSLELQCNALLSPNIRGRMFGIGRWSAVVMQGLIDYQPRTASNTGHSKSAGLHDVHSI